ncbi:beta-galactosidase trimerization domain-containing protein [bacterium]|nr:beta-galactosidase trimerization domain-containing protein [bacterium]
MPQRKAEKMQDKEWWLSGPLRLIEIEEGYLFREKMRILKKLKANMEHLTRFADPSIFPGVAYIDDRQLFPGEKVTLATLNEYLAEAHSQGIKVVIYYNVHAVERSYARKHPEWQQIQEDGKPIETVYEVDSSFCINSGWREEVFKALRTLAFYEIDGIFFDGPIFFANTCYCESCKRLFRENYGRELPSKTRLSASRDDPDWKLLIEFQTDSIARFLRDCNAVLKAINPQIMLYMNGNPIAPSWTTGRDNRKIIRETDILGAEGGFLYGGLEEPIYKPGATAKLLETQAQGKPTVVFDAGKQGPWAFSMLPPGEISLLYSQTISHGAQVWFAICSEPSLHPQEMEVVRKYNEFIEKNPDPFFSTHSLARIALVWPQRTSDYYLGSPVPHTDFTKEMRAQRAGNLLEEFYGFYDGLVRNHFPFDVIDEEALLNVDKYDLLILPNVAHLREEEMESIRNFLRRGGNLIASFETSLYDYGERRDNFGLKDVFGMKRVGEIFGPLRWDYVTSSDKGHFSLKGINQKLIYAPTYGIEVESDARKVLMFCHPLPGCYAGRPQPSPHPFLIENKFGKGRVIYLAGTFGTSLFSFRFPEFYRILRNLVSRMSRPLIELEGVPSSLEVSLRRKGDRIYIHLINFTSEMKRPIERIVPLYAVEITLHFQDAIKSVRSLWQKYELEFREERGKVSFSLPRLEDYDLIEIEIGEKK